MIYSADLPPFVKAWEALRTRAYWDGAIKANGDKLWTCGYGHTRDVREDTTCTGNMAEMWLHQDLDEAAAAVWRLSAVTLKPYQFDALTDFVFAFGEGKFKNSTLLTMVRASSHDRAALQLLRWNRQGEKVVHGLLARRAGEALMYAYGDYAGR